MQTICVVVKSEVIGVGAGEGRDLGELEKRCHVWILWVVACGWEVDDKCCHNGVWFRSARNRYGWVMSLTMNEGSG